MPANLLEDLRGVPLLSKLTDDELRWLAENGTELVLAAGDVVIRAGDRADGMVIILDGMIEARQPPGQPGGPPTFWVRKGDITGVLPFSRMTTYSRMTVAVCPSRVLRIPTSRFEEMLQRIPSIQAPLVGLLIDRVRTFTRLAEQREKLSALGRFAAGLAHELNNPASAVRRGVADASDRLARISALAGALACAGVDAGVLADLDRLRETGLRNRREPHLEDALERSDREQAIAAWLDQQGVSEPWMAAGTLVEARLGPLELEPLLARLTGQARSLAIEYLEAHLSAGVALATSRQAATRIAALVEAAKEHTQMDRGQELVPVDVRVGLDTTLALYGERAAEKRASIERRFSEPVPSVRGYPGSLNEVWAQLLANALEAVETGAGRISVRVRGELDRVVVEIVDNGHGVPPEIADRIWEPFFTTRPGPHTGLGLDIARRVIEQHGGEIDQTGGPGSTCFTVRLPVGGLAPHVI